MKDNKFVVRIMNLINLEINLLKDLFVGKFYEIENVILEIGNENK